MKPVLLLALLATASLLHAASSSPSSTSSSTLVVVAGVRAGETPVTVTVPADYLAVEIRIESDEADWGLKLAGIEDARRELATAAARESFRLRIDRSLVFQPRYQKLSFSSSSGGQHDAHSDILVLAPIGEDTDLVPVVRRIRSLVTELKLPKKVSVASGNLFLALENPELHRAELLGKIRAHVDATSRALTDTRSFSVTGLDGPLRLRQSGERHIDIYLPFQATYSPATRAR